AEALVQQVGETLQHFTVLRALFYFHNTKAEYPAAQALAERLLDVAQRQDDPTLLLEAHYALGINFDNTGAPVPARIHLEQGVACDNLQQQATPHPLPGVSGRLRGVHCRAVLANTLWRLGYPDQAAQRIRETLTMAHALAYPRTL